MRSIHSKARRQRSLSRMNSWTNLILLLYLLVGILLSTILLAIPLSALSLGANEVFLGGIVSGFVSAGLVLSFIGAAVCDRLGERSVLIIAFGSYAVAHLLGALGVSSFLLLLSATIAGVGDMLFTVGGMTYLTRLVTNRDSDLTISAAFSLLRIGSVAGSIGAGGIAESLGFKAVFLIGLLVSLVALLLSVLLPNAGREPQSSPVGVSDIPGSYKVAYSLFRKNRSVRLAACITGLGTVGWFTFRSSFYLDHLRRAGMLPGVIGLVTGAGSAAMVLAPFVYSLLTTRVDPLPAMAVGLLFAGSGLAVTPLLRTAIMIGSIGGLAQMGDFFRLPGVYSLLSAYTSPRDRPAAVAIMNTSWAAAALIAGPLWGLVVRSLGLATVFYIAGLGIVIGTVALCAFDRRPWKAGRIRSSARRSARDEEENLSCGSGAHRSSPEKWTAR